MAVLFEKLWVGLTISLLLMLQVSTGFAADTQTIKLIYFSNMPEVEDAENRPGLARVATYIKQTRQDAMNTLVFHGGDSLSPSILSSLDKGAHMIDLLNAIEIDVMAVAKRELAYGEDVLIQRAEEALFPLVSSNTFDAATNAPFEAVQTNEIFDIGGIQLGVVVLTAPQVIREYATKRTIVRETPASALEEAKMLRDEGANIIVLSADFDLSDQADLFASGLFDIVLQASTEVTEPTKVDETYYIREKSDGTGLTQLDIDLVSHQDGYSISKIVAIRPNLSAIEPDQDMLTMVEAHVQPLTRLLDAPLGRLTGEISTLRNQVRSQENAFANLLADSIRIATGADIALINGGSIRGNKSYGTEVTVTRKDLQAELPFRNTIALLEVTGQQLWNALEYGLLCRRDLDGCFPHVSNLTVTYSPDTDTLVSVEMAGQDISLERTYVLATTDFLAIGGDGYKAFQDAKRVVGPESGQLTREILSQYIRDQGNIALGIEGRIVFVDQ